VKEPRNLLAQLHHPRTNSASIDLDFGFTGTARTHTGALATDLPTGLTGHRVTPTAKARK
jgi:hypothetical protein